MIDILNALIRVLGVVISQVVGLLPATPFHVDSGTLATINTYAGWAAFVLPLSEVRTLLGLVIAAIVVWYGIRLALRFFQLVQG